MASPDPTRTVKRIGVALTWVVLMVVTLFVVSVLVLFWAPFSDLKTWGTHRTLEIVFAGLPLPPETEVQNAIAGGSWHPFDSPPSRTHDYVITGDTRNVRERLLGGLRAQGWSVRPWLDSPCDLEARVGRLNLVLDFPWVRGDRHACPGGKDEVVGLSVRISALTENLLRYR